MPGTGSYLAFYPYDAKGLTYADGAVGFTLPVTQTAQAGSFAPGVNPAWAQTTEAGGQLAFHNAAALVKFTLTASGGLGTGQSLKAGVITNLGEIPLASVPVTGVPISFGGESSAIAATGEIWAD